MGRPMTDRDRAMLGDLMDILPKLEDHERDFVRHHWDNPDEPLSQLQAEFIRSMWGRWVRREPEGSGQ
jgi:hypothetical protein